MHTFLYRINALITFSLNYHPRADLWFGFFLRQFQHSVGMQVLNVNLFQKQNGNDEVSFNVERHSRYAVVVYLEHKAAAEYETPEHALNQVSLWDAIILAKDSAFFGVQISNKYRFIDQGSNLHGRSFNLTLHWHVMPKTGKMFADKVVVSGYRLPNKYI